MVNLGKGTEMTYIEYIMNADGDKIEVTIPEELQGKEVKVVVTEHKSEKIKRFDEMPIQERLKALETYKGTARYPDATYDKYDIYEQ